MQIRNLINLVFTLMLLASPLVTRAAGESGAILCDPAKTIHLLNSPNRSLYHPFQGSPGTCSGLFAVFQRLAGQLKAGGRKLEDDRPLDVAQAQAELQKARANVEFQAELRDALGGESDLLRKTVIEAALLHDFGNFRARDLLIQQISKEAR